MGSLVPAGSNALAAYGGVNPWAEAARSVDTGAYLKFNGNTGDITFGSDDEALPVGSRLVVDMSSLAFGWTCWIESQVEEEILVPVTDGKPPLEHELKDHGPYDDDDDGWRESTSFSAVLLEFGEDPNHETVGTKLLFKSSTGGPVRSTRKLAGAYGKLFMQHPDELPIVEISTESYTPKVKKHGKKWSIIFKIVGWIGEEELASLTMGAADDEDDYVEPDQKKKRAAEPEDEPAPRRRAAARDEEEEAPAPRRRAAARDEEEEAPAPRRRAAARDEEEEAPAPRRRAAAASEEEEAPAPRRRAAAASEEEEEETPAPRRRRAEPAEVEAADEDEGEVAPAPRGRSPGRGTSARMRRFD